MTTITLLSSSPPRTFARSPTPILSSSPLPSPGAILRGDEDARKRFKRSAITRDSFAGGFHSARSLLTTRKGAENIPVRSPGKDKFKSPKPSQEKAIAVLAVDSINDDLKFATASHATSCFENAFNLSPVRNTGSIQSHQPSTAPFNKTIKQLLEVSNLESSDITESTSLRELEKAVPRRKDWTPVKNRGLPEEQGVEGVLGSETAFPAGLLSSFQFQSTSTVPVPQTIEVGPRPTKRRKVEIFKEPSASSKRKNDQQSKSISNKRIKSPTKKSLTITGLATSNYKGNTEISRTNPMMDYLSATQARTLEDDQESEAAVAAAKPTKKKARSAKSRPVKPTLLSPASAMKSFDEQEAMFGSASQLARDDSPRLLRDTLEAVKRSQENLMSDPVSTQQTFPISIESITPKAAKGVSRFVKSRNLWSVAGRDEDNALLHVDNTDLCDTPTTRLAFAGKDVLVEAGTVTRPPITPSLHLRGGGFSSDHGGLSGAYDIDDLISPAIGTSNVSPNKEFVKMYHSSSKTSVDPTELDANEQSVQAAPPLVVTKTPAKKRTKKSQSAKKPSFSVLTDNELKKQISSFGFKPVKKREKMIELLEKCWEQKHASQDQDNPSATTIATTESLKHSDFITKIHDVSARPTPKVKKARKTPSANTDDGASQPPAKKSRTAKAKDEATKPVTKAPRKRKAKTATKLSEETVLDSDTIDADVHVVSAVAETAASKTKPVPLSPISSMPAENANANFAEETSSTNRTIAKEANTTPAPEAMSMDEQIQTAVLFESKSSDPNRDHVRDPTWHEKILLYDPIVLEDFTKWLNTRGLGMINEDREVDALQVRAWCESNSICCLWKGGWRGNKGKDTEG